MEDSKTEIVDLINVTNQMREDIAAVLGRVEFTHTTSDASEKLEEAEALLEILEEQVTTLERRTVIVPRAPDLVMDDFGDVRHVKFSVPEHYDLYRTWGDGIVQQSKLESPLTKGDGCSGGCDD